MRGLMQDRPLVLPYILHRAEQLFGHKTLITGVCGGGETSVTVAEWAVRVRRLATAMDALGVPPDGRVATFCWNSARHLELYLAAPCTGRVLHTLNIRLFPDELVYVANHAQDDVVFVDRSLLPVFWPLRERLTTIRHFVVIDDGADHPVPEGVLDYEDLLAGAEPFDGRFAVDDEHRAAAMCYSSGTTCHPKGVVYSHRSTMLHSLVGLAVDMGGWCERDVALAVVPMFHANAWGIPYAALLAGAEPGPPRAQHNPTGDPGHDRAPPRHRHRGSPDDLDGRAAPSRRVRPVVVDADLLWRVGRPAPALRGLPRGHRYSDHALLGHDRDVPDRDHGDPALAVRRCGRGRPGGGLRPPGAAGAAGGAAPGGPGDAGAVPWDDTATARSRPPARGARAVLPRARAARSSPTTAGCAPATWPPWTASARPDRRPDQGPGEVGRGVDQLGGAGERIMSHPKVAEAAVIGVPHERWTERPLACVVTKPGESLSADDLRRTSAHSCHVVAARRRGVHRRGAQDQRREVLQAHPAGALRRLRAHEPRGVGPGLTTRRLTLSPAGRRTVIALRARP